MRKFFAFSLIIAFFAVLSGCDNSCSGADTSEPSQEPFSVTSGETTIYPLGHFMYGTQYDEETGQGLAADGFPQLAEWADRLESVHYEQNFALWVRDEQTTLDISIAGIYANLSCEDIAALPAGEYIVACRLTTQGEYVEKANDYNSSTSVYWFRLIKS